MSFATNQETVRLQAKNHQGLCSKHKQILFVLLQFEQEFLGPFCFSAPQGTHLGLASVALARREDLHGHRHGGSFMFAV